MDTLESRVNESVAKARMQERNGAKLMGIIARRDADDGSTWWDIESIYEVPKDTTVAKNVWPNARWQFPDQSFACWRLDSVDGDLIDGLVGRPEVLAICGRLSKALSVSFFLCEGPNSENLKWWLLPHSPVNPSQIKSKLFLSKPTKETRLVLSTGAGISAESGIKTFRDGNGLWNDHRIEDVASPEGFRANPKLVQDFYNQRRQQLHDPQVRPNLAHLALAELEACWPGDFLLVTQNVDNLHERAGSHKLIHMHGELLKVRCQVSGIIYEWPGAIEPSSVCVCCGKPETLRPHIVWFGEYPLQMAEIEQKLKRCDLFISIGTSGLVYPAAGFKQKVPPDSMTVQINIQKDPNDRSFKEYRTGPATQTVPGLVSEILSQI